MAQRTREEYDAAYFGDPKTDLRRKFAYANYLRQLDNLTEKKWKDFIAEHKLKPTDKILELGGAVGHFAKVAREQGLNVTCVDWSQWCLDNKLISNLIHEDALTYLKSQPDNSFDVVVSFFFLDCIPKNQLKELAQEIKRVTPKAITTKPKQFHQLYPGPNPRYYNVQNVSYWLSMGFQNVLMVNG